MTARRKFESRLLPLVPLVVCAGLLTAAKGKEACGYAGDGQTLRGPLADASVCVEEGRVPGRWHLRVAVRRRRWEKAKPGSLASIAFLLTLSPRPTPASFPLTWFRNAMSLFSVVWVVTENRGKPSGNCAVAAALPPWRCGRSGSGWLGVVPGLSPGPGAAGKVARAKFGLPRGFGYQRANVLLASSPRPCAHPPSSSGSDEEIPR